MKNIVIVVDSAIHFSPNECKQKGYEYSPLLIIEGGQKTLRDRIDITTDELYEKLNQKTDIKTAQESLGNLEELFTSLINKYDYVFYLPISKALSGAYSQGCTLKAMLETDKMVVVDTDDVACGISEIAELITDANTKNKTIQQTLDLIEERKLKRLAVLSTADLDRLIQGGRLGKVKGLLAKMLGIHVMVEFNGKLKFLGKSKNFAQTFKLMKEHIFKTLSITDDSQIKKLTFLNSFEAKQKTSINDCQNIIATIFPNIQFETILIPNIITCHLGKNAYSIYIEKK